MKTALCAAILLGALTAATPAETNTASSAAVGSRESRWNENLDCFARELPARHLDFFKLIPKKTFGREVGNLRRELPRLSDVEAVFRLMHVGARLGVALNAGPSAALKAEPPPRGSRTSRAEKLGLFMVTGLLGLFSILLLPQKRSLQAHTCPRRRNPFHGRIWVPS